MYGIDTTAQMATHIHLLLTTTVIAYGAPTTETQTDLRKQFDKKNRKSFHYFDIKVKNEKVSIMKV